MSRKEILILVTIVALAGFLRFFELTQTPPGLYPDEAMNGNNGIEALANHDLKVFYTDNNGREGLFINLQALSVWMFGREAWALRGVSALVGTLTVLALYFVAKELFIDEKKRNFTFRLNPPNIIALLSAYLLATSYWHLNFSRIGFRAICLPLFASVALYFLLKGLRTGKTLDMILAGIFTGLGLYTYIAFRFMVFILAIPVVGYGWKWVKGKVSHAAEQIAGCFPCAVLTFTFATFVVALPFGYYFLHHPEDFSSRSSQISVFAAKSPIFEFAKSTIATIAMPLVFGDCNPRHNLPCRPELSPLVAIFFLVGLAASIKRVVKSWGSREAISHSLILGWLIFMMFPASLTREGMPHALRAIGMIPPMIILAGFGAWIVGNKLLEIGQRKFGEKSYRPTILLFLAALATIFFLTYKTYFVVWAQDPKTQHAFTADTFTMARYLNGLDDQTEKLVIVDEGIDQRTVTISSQTILFITGSFLQTDRANKHYHYIRPQQLDETLAGLTGKKIVISFLDNASPYPAEVAKNHLEFHVQNFPNFLILEN